ncbi:MAG: 4,5-DOPA dioxygenase extradiol [Bacteroidota bacterium]
MQRKDFIKLMAALPLSASAMKLQDLHQITQPLSSTERMPVLFLGHGSPMNAIEENEFVRGFREVVKTIPLPRAILCVSAHWETRGTFVTAMEHPKTIYDFGGFPKALFEVQYPAPGSPAVAQEIKNTVSKVDIGLDASQWGLDHGAWSVIKHLYPEANVPVLQLSIDRFQSPQYHYDLAKELQSLRSKGILIMGSGNMVHNLGMVAWDRINEVGFAYDWAQEADAAMKKYMLQADHQKLIDFKSRGKAFDLAIPTPEHYLPLLYALALQVGSDNLTLFNDKPLAGSLTMTSVRIG